MNELRKTVYLRDAQQAKQVLDRMYDWAKPYLLAGHELCVKTMPLTRSLEQNAKMWAMLTDVSQQVEWYGKRLTAEDWKHVFSASLRKLSVVPNLDGTGFVALGLSTSAMSKREMSDMVELIYSFGAEKGVKWTEGE